MLQRKDALIELTPHSSKHTARNASSDMSKMTEHLLDSQITAEKEDRKSPAFRDPTEDGWKKLTKGWLDNILSHHGDDQGDMVLEEGYGEVEECELSDIDV